MRPDNYTKLISTKSHQLVAERHTILCRSSCMTSNSHFPIDCAQLCCAATLLSEIDASPTLSGVLASQVPAPSTLLQISLSSFSHPLATVCFIPVTVLGAARNRLPVSWSLFVFIFIFPGSDRHLFLAAHSLDYMAPSIVFSGRRHVLQWTVHG